MEFSLPFILVASVFTVVVGWLYLRESRRNPAFAWTFVFFYSFASKQLSIFYLDFHSVYMIETDTVSGPSWASLRMLLYHATMIAGMITGTRLLQRSTGIRIGGLGQAPALLPPVPPRFIHQGVLGVLLLVMFAQYVNLALSSQLALTGGEATRYNFWAEYARFPILEKIFGNTIGFVPLAAACCFWAASRHEDRVGRRLATGLIVAHQLCLLATGQRFHGFLLTMGPVIALYLFYRVQTGQVFINRRAIILGVAFFACILAYGLFDVSQRGMSQREEIGEYAPLYRIFVIQGGVLWAMHGYVDLAGPNGNWRDFFDGMTAVIVNLMPSALGQAYLEKGVNLASGLPATAIWVLGLSLAVPFLFFFGLIQGGLLHLVFRVARDNNALAAVFAYYLFSALTVMYSSGSLRPLASPVTLAALAGVLVSLMFVSSLRERMALVARPRTAPVRLRRLSPQLSEES